MGGINNGDYHQSAPIPITEHYLGSNIASTDGIPGNTENCAVNGQHMHAQMTEAALLLGEVA